MKYRPFENVATMEQETLALLREHFDRGGIGPTAVMLTGGRTPLGIYRQLRQSPPPINDRLHLLISDERHVPIKSSQSNFGVMRPMLDSLGIDQNRILRVHPELTLDEAAQRYDSELSALLDAEGQITLGILGLGADGHLASLFNMDDVRRGAGRYAIAVLRTPGPNRVSVTQKLLQKVQKLVFLVSGPEKATVVEQMVAGTGNLTANEVVRGIDTELWFSP